jgi:VanZ family protein
MRLFLKYWLPLLIWLAVMFVGSTDLFSAEHTSRFIVPFLLWLKPGMSPLTIRSIMFGLRKCAHVCEYAVLALLWWRALRSAPLRMRATIVVGLVVLGCALFAASDEFHQSFVKSRTPSVRDVFLDISGAVLGLLIGMTFAFCRRKKKAGSVADAELVNARL